MMPEEKRIQELEEENDRLYQKGRTFEQKAYAFDKIVAIVAEGAPDALARIAEVVGKALD